MKYSYFTALLLSLHSLSALADGTLTSAAARSEFIRTAKVWTPPSSGIATQDFSQNAPECKKYEPDSVVTCTFKKPKRGDDASGLTSKFRCAEAGGKDLKVKYGQDNAEVFSEVFSGRLLQSMGFPADCNYPVQKVICLDCPAEPFSYSLDYMNGTENPNEVFTTREFAFAMIEGKYGEEIVAELGGKRVEGFGFDELFKPATQHSAKEQQVAREALTILMAVLQHGDNRPSNQRLYCDTALDADGTCAPEARTLVVQDLGATLGGYKIRVNDGALLNATPSLAHGFWSKAPVWAFYAGPVLSQCRVQVIAGGSTGDGPPSLTVQKVSEAGRKFLVERLQGISKEQLYQLVQLSKIDKWVGSPNINADLVGEFSHLSGLPVPPGLGLSVASVPAKVWVETLWAKLNAVSNRGGCRN